MSADEWAATKTRIEKTVANGSHVQRGLRFLNDVPELVHEVERLREIVRLLNENLSALQKDSSARLDEERGTRWLEAHADGFLPVMTGIAGEIWRANNSFGAPKDLIGRADGTGHEYADLAAYLKAACDALGACAPWVVVLAEEIGEVLEQSDPAKMYPELLQVAALAIRWAMTLRLRAGK